MSQHPEPIVIAQYRGEFEASLVRNALVGEGIPCELSGVHSAGFRAEVPGWVKVLIPADCEARARAIIEGFQREGGSDGWDVGEGEAGEGAGGG